MMSTINDLCSVIVDCEHKTSPEDDSGKYFAVGTPAMRGNVIDFNGARRISHETFIAWTRRLEPKFGDLLFAREAPVGPIVQIPVEENIAPGQRTVLMRPNPALADSRYLYYRLSSSVEQERLQAMAGGSTVAHLNVADIRAFRLAVPSLFEQRAIAEVLGALDDKIAANTRLAFTLADLVSTKFMEASRTAINSVKLSEIVTTQYGLTTSAHDGEGPKFLRVTDINKKPWVEWDSTPSCTVDPNDLAKYRVEAGDILVARMADPGKAAFIDEGDPVAVFASYLVRLRALDTRQSTYIYYFLRSSKYLEYAEGAMQGSVQMNMNAKVIVATDIPMPSPEIIENFRATVAVLRRSIQAALQENRTLAVTRDALLPQLMSGKLRVRNAETAVEAVV